MMILCIGLLSTVTAIQVGVKSDVENQNLPRHDSGRVLEEIAVRENTPSNAGFSPKQMLGVAVGGLCVGAAITAGVFVATNDNSNDNNGNDVDPSSVYWVPVTTDSYDMDTLYSQNFFDKCLGIWPIRGNGVGSLDRICDAALDAYVDAGSPSEFQRYVDLAPTQERNNIKLARFQTLGAFQKISADLASWNVLEQYDEWQNGGFIMNVDFWRLENHPALAPENLPFFASESAADYFSNGQVSNMKSSEKLCSLLCENPDQTLFDKTRGVRRGLEYWFVEFIVARSWVICESYPDDVNIDCFCKLHSKVVDEVVGVVDEVEDFSTCLDN